MAIGDRSKPTYPSVPTRNSATVFVLIVWRRFTRNLPRMRIAINVLPPISQCKFVGCISRIICNPLILKVFYEHIEVGMMEYGIFWNAGLWNISGLSSVVLPAWSNRSLHQPLSASDNRSDRDLNRLKSKFRKPQYSGSTLFNLLKLILKDITDSDSFPEIKHFAFSHNINSPVCIKLNWLTKSTTKKSEKSLILFCRNQIVLLDKLRKQFSL